MASDTAPAADLSGTDFGKSIQSYWLLEEGCSYLNHGAFGAVSRPVFEGAQALRGQIAAQPSRFMREELPGRLRASAALLGDYMGAEGEDIVFVDNATTGINAVLRSLVLLPGDEVVTTSHAYGAVLRTLEFVCERAGARLLFADLPYPMMDAGDAVEAVTARLSPRTRLLVLDHITSVTALRLPIEEIIEECNDWGIPVLVDGAHAPGILPLELGTLGATWYVGNCHKWLGAARGCGFIWTAKEDQKLVRPTTISHFIGQGYTAAFDWPGTKDFAAYLSVEEAIAFRARFGEDRISAYCHGLAWQGLNLLRESWGGMLGSVEDGMTFMGTVTLPGSHRPDQPTADALRRRLREEHEVEVEIKAFDDRLWVRACAYLYNDITDFERLAAAVKAL